MDKENCSFIDESCTIGTFPLKRTSTESTRETELLSERITQTKTQTESNQEKDKAGKKTMNSFVTIRPPRDPKHSESVATATNSTALPNPSAHRHRSSSQPRQSQTTMHTSSRSASQPRSSQNAHFLDGFNVADCFDVRKIPDPPSSSPSDTRRRHRRRVSSAVLRPMSSMDVNNRKNNDPISTTNHTTGSDAKSSFSTRRKRKTLLHVPSPLYQEGSQKVNEEKCDVELRPRGQPITMYRDDYEDPKRKKKRQSIVIPRDLPLEVDACSSDTTSVNDFHGNSHSVKNSPSKAKKDFCTLDFKSMQNLRNLVRGYCDLSGEQRGSSIEAKEILSITGYALPRKTTIIDGSNRSAAVLSNRRLVIQKIAPVLTQMEARKKRDTTQWENKTKCRVSRSQKSGRYKYHDIESNQKVASQEYKRRYISILEDERPNRFSRACQWMNELYDHSTSIDINRQEQNRIDSRAALQREAFIPPMNTNLVKDGIEGSKDVGTNDFIDTSEPTMSADHQSSGMSMVYTTEMSEIAEITEVSSEDTDDTDNSPQESIVSSPTNSTASDVGNVKDMGRNNNTENIPLLPLPSKDVESTDPDIAAAEKRLWDKFDLALHEYSGEVMMIKKKKRRLA